MMNETKTQAALGNARQELKDTLERVKELRVKIANLRLDVAAERALNRSARAAERAERAAARIAKAEARLEALKRREWLRSQKAAKKPTKVVVWTAEQIAALNAERGLA
jgi:hypothetical protein